MKPILFVDNDGVVANSMLWWVTLYNLANGTEWKVSDFTEWDTRKQHGVDLYPFFRDYWGVYPVRDAIKSIKILQNSYRIVFATAGFGADWLRTYFGDPEIIHVQDKGLLRGYALIDDRPMNLDAFQGQRYLLSQPWNSNRGLNDSTWEQITKHLMEAV